MKPLSLNFKELYYPTLHMERAIKETVQYGLTRLEITYTADTLNGENELLDEIFPGRAEVDLWNVFLALKTVQDICYHLPLSTLLNTFNAEARKEQLLIVQPSLAALVYASNSKASCFSANRQVVNPRSPFKHVDFLAAQALPGPESMITCIIQRWGDRGVTRILTL